MAALQTSFAKSRANSLIARLLYGANVDRNAKARARVGLAIAGCSCSFMPRSQRGSSISA